MSKDTAYRLGFGIALFTGFVILWLTVGPGLLGIEEEDRANVLYLIVLAVGFFGAIIARFRPRGLAWTAVATALAQTLVGAFALTYPNTAGPLAIVILHGAFVAAFAISALLFRYAARQ